MKQVFLFLFLLVSPVLLFAQQPDSIMVKDSLSIVTDSSLVLPSLNEIALNTDSIGKADTIFNTVAMYNNSFNKIMEENQLLNAGGIPVSMENNIKKPNSRDNFFYILASIGVILGFFRFFYTRYFNNLFRVFFNASLRQSQLTDQLLQAKLPSLLFNIVFVLTGGLYVYLLLRYYNWISINNFWLILFYCILSLAGIYLVKYITLKFTGWLTGYKEITNTYVFIIFLINKILGILLLPFAVIIAFSMPALSTAAVIISLLFIGLMFLLRFFRSYGLLQHKVKVSRFHFFLYVAGIEIVPVLLIYKGLVLLLSKNL